MAKKTKPGHRVNPSSKAERPKRSNRVVVSFTDKELDAIKLYCKRYKVKSKAGFMREMALRAVMIKFLDDYPTLFGKGELDSLVVKQTSTT